MPSYDFNIARGNKTKQRCPKCLAAPKALAAVQTLITSAIANSDVATVRASRRILLKMGDGIIQGFNRTRSQTSTAHLTVPGAPGSSYIQYFRIF